MRITLALVALAVVTSSASAQYHPECNRGTWQRQSDCLQERLQEDSERNHQEFMEELRRRNREETEERRHQELLEEMRRQR